MLFFKKKYTDKTLPSLPSHHYWGWAILRQQVVHHLHLLMPLVWQTALKWSEKPLQSRWWSHTRADGLHGYTAKEKQQKSDKQLFSCFKQMRQIHRNSCSGLACFLVYLAGVFPFPAAFKGILDTLDVLVRNKLPGKGRMVWRFFFLILMSCMSRANSVLGRVKSEPVGNENSIIQAFR